MLDHMKINHKEIAEAFSQTAVQFSVKCQQTEMRLNVEPFENYPCFYCGRSIVSEKNVSEHFRNCKGLQNRNTPPVNSNKVVVSDKQSAINLYQSMLSVLQTVRFKCDVCPRDFESENMLKLHKMADHQTKFGIL